VNFKESSSMKTRSVVAHGLLLTSIAMMTVGCAHTDTKVNATNTVDSMPSARGTSTAPGAPRARYQVKEADAEDTAATEDKSGTLAQAVTPESEADMARALLFFPVFGVRVPIW
jgi:hypothetical protein